MMTKRKPTWMTWTKRMTSGNRALLCAAILTVLSCFSATSKAAEHPNVVVIHTDDQGYADTGAYGATGFQTPNLDQMSAEGIRFTSAYAVSNACSPSRAAMLTGCYPMRVGIPDVLGPSKKQNGHAVGLHPNEITMAELLKPLGYATACIGKWHLGDIPEFLPMNQGFDVYFGLPYSNDMWPNHPTAKDYPDLPLMEGNDVVELNPSMDQLTTRYTEHAVQFIRDNKDHPFFLYLAHNMPHVPLGVSDKFRGKSAQGLYGDVIMEIDWSVGEILRTLKEAGLDDRTLVVFTSDNGPWLSYGNHAGSAIPLREGKGTTWEGGHRVPCIVRWPGKIPAGQVCDKMIANFDFYPTVAEATGAPLPTDRVIDGKSLWPLLSGTPGAGTPHEYFFFYGRSELQAVRKGPWKLHLPHQYRSLDGPAGSDGLPAPYIQRETPLALYNLTEDVEEKHNQASGSESVVQELQAATEAFKAALLVEARPAGRYDPPETTPPSQAASGN